MRRSCAVLTLSLLVPLAGCFGKMEVVSDETRTGVFSGRLPDAGAAEADASAPKPRDACELALEAIHFDFEGGPQGWTHAPTEDTAPLSTWAGADPWEYGVPSSGAPCASGSCFASQLEHNYESCMHGHLVSPAIDLSACAGRDVSVVFAHAYAFWTGTYGGRTWSDGGYVEVSRDGETWQVPTPDGGYPGTLAILPGQEHYVCSEVYGDGAAGFVGQQVTTTKTALRLPSSAIGPTTRLRFTLSSGLTTDSGGTLADEAAKGFGWRIDDVGFEVR